MKIELFKILGYVHLLILNDKLFGFLSLFPFRYCTHRVHTYRILHRKSLERKSKTWMRFETFFIQRRRNLIKWIFLCTRYIKSDFVSKIKIYKFFCFKIVTSIISMLHDISWQQNFFFFFWAKETIKKFSFEFFVFVLLKTWMCINSARLLAFCNIKYEVKSILPFTFLNIWAKIILGEKSFQKKSLEENSTSFLLPFF